MNDIKKTIIFIILKDFNFRKTKNYLYIKINNIFFY